MVLHCCVPFCQNVTKIRNIHRFPYLDEKLYNVWLQIVRRPDLENMDPIRVFQNYGICDRHFDDSMKVNRGKYPSQSELILGAYPTLFLPNQSESTQEMYVPNEATEMTTEMIEQDKSLASQSETTITFYKSQLLQVLNISPDSAMSILSNSPESSSPEEVLWNGKEARNYCSVHGCNRNIQPLYRMPNPRRDIYRFLAWREVLQNPRYEAPTNEELYRRVYVCHRHFTSDDFVKSGFRSLLKKTAIPSLNLPAKITRLNRPGIDKEPINPSSVRCQIDFSSPLGEDLHFWDVLDEPVRARRTPTQEYYILDVDGRDSVTPEEVLNDLHDKMPTGKISENSPLKIEPRPLVFLPVKPLPDESVPPPSPVMDHYTTGSQTISESAATEILYTAQSDDILSPSMAEITLITEPLISNTEPSHYEAEGIDSAKRQFCEVKKTKLCHNDDENNSKTNKRGNQIKKSRKKHPLFDSLWFQIAIPSSWSRISPVGSKNCIIFANFYLDKKSCLVPFKEVCVFKNGDIVYSHFGERVKLEYENYLTSVEALEATIERFDAYEVQEA